MRFFWKTYISVRIGRISTNILKVVLGPRAHHGPGGHQWQKVAKKQKSKRNESLDLFTNRFVSIGMMGETN